MVRERAGELQTSAAEISFRAVIAEVMTPSEVASSRLVASGEVAAVNSALVARAAMSVQRMVSVLVLMPVTSAQAIVSVFALIAVTSAQAMVSVFALIKPFEVTSPSMSVQSMVSVLVLMPVIFPTPTSVMRVSTLL